MGSCLSKSKTKDDLLSDLNPTITLESIDDDVSTNKNNNFSCKVRKRDACVKINSTSMTTQRTSGHHALSDYSHAYPKTSTDSPITTDSGSFDKA